MKQIGLSAFTDTYLTATGLIIFFMFFVGVLYRVFISNSKKNYDYFEQIPLKDGE